MRVVERGEEEEEEEEGAEDEEGEEKGALGGGEHCWGFWGVSRLSGCLYWKGGKKEERRKEGGVSE